MYCSLEGVKSRRFMPCSILQQHSDDLDRRLGKVSLPRSHGVQIYDDVI
jgi:hypothetical protein